VNFALFDFRMIGIESFSSERIFGPLSAIHLSESRVGRSSIV
jgi:hypothetical protein